MGSVGCDQIAFSSLGQLLHQSSDSGASLQRKAGSIILPETENFPVTLLGFDDDNFGYIQCLSSKYDKWWDKLNSLMESVRDTAKRLSYNDYKVGEVVMLKIPNGKSEVLFRAKILQVPVCPGERVECLRVDNYSIYHAHPQSIFELPEPIQAISDMAVRVQVDGLQFFSSLNVFNWKQNQRDIFRRGTRSEVFKATKVGTTEVGVDVLKLIGDDGQTLLSKIQPLIASSCRFEMVESVLSYAEYRQVLFTYVDAKCDYIWLQPLNNPIMDRINEVLAAFTPSENQQPIAQGDTDIEGSLQKLMLQIEEMKVMYVTRFDDMWHRARIINFRDKTADTEEMVEVEYIDFGGTTVVPRSNLILASQVDYNLTLIPPQILKAKIDKEGDPTLQPFFAAVIQEGAKIWVKVGVRSMKSRIPIVNVLIPEGFFSNIPHKPVPLVSDESGIMCSYPSSEDITLLEIKELVEMEQQADEESDQFTIENLDQLQHPIDEPSPRDTEKTAFPKTSSEGEPETSPNESSSTDQSSSNSDDQPSPLSSELSKAPAVPIKVRRPSRIRLSQNEIMSRVWT